MTTLANIQQQQQQHYISYMKYNARLYKRVIIYSKSDEKNNQEMDNNEQSGGSSSVPVQFYLNQKFDTHQSFASCTIYVKLHPNVEDQNCHKHSNKH